ncbi:glycosyltransferase family 2 protein [Candidatus Avelusimicrobium alvi]|uniref:glycosyltransferase family 2 protein n=1 Tax=Candidatus Avelusimicrobium alvi TaxID=3416221 RepID=UPI003D0DCD93
MNFTSANEPVFSVVLPCLNEAPSLPGCLQEIRQAADKINLPYEIIVADNGSTDASARLAREQGARVVAVAIRGYGAALQAGLSAARGRAVVFADADGSYPFCDLARFLQPVLEDKVDLVLGNRLNDQLLPGAMPWLNRYFGTPFLSWVLRTLYPMAVYDCNGGMRALRRELYDGLALRQPGMEYASEMLLRAGQKNWRYLEIPISLRPAHPSHRPHIRPLADGLRHLWTMLKYRFSREH